MRLVTKHTRIINGNKVANWEMISTLLNKTSAKCKMKYEQTLLEEINKAPPPPQQVDCVFSLFICLLLLLFVFVSYVFFGM